MASHSAEEVAHVCGKPSRQQNGGYMALCPAHDDKNPSLSLRDTADGFLLWHCFAGCASETVQEELFDMLPDFYPYPQRQPKHSITTGERGSNPVPTPDFVALLGRKPSATYRYTDGAGLTIGYVCRLHDDAGRKTFIPLTFAGNQWRKKGFGSKTPLYRQLDLVSRPDATVLVVEGEKTADSARMLFPDYAVTTWPNGANAVKLVDVSLLNDRNVVIWPDADEPGMRAARTLRDRLLNAAAASVRLVELPAGLPAGWDLADEIPEGLDPQKLLSEAKHADGTLAQFVKTAAELAKTDIPPLEYVIEPFLPTNSLMMIFAKRGVGKTWVAMSLAIAIARGEPFLTFDVPKPRVVLFWDGEMTLVDIKTRLSLLGAKADNNLLIMASEILFRESRAININEPDDQAMIIRTLEKLDARKQRPGVIIFDNLSSLGGGIDENDNSALEAQLQWLLGLRHRGYAVVLVHHAGKSGDQRGASRREDLLDTSIKLEKPDEKEFEGDISGATFTLEFVKTRGVPPQPSTLTLSLRPNEDDVLEFQISGGGSSSAPIRVLKVIFDGVTETDSGGRARCRPLKNQAEIVGVIGKSKGTISKNITQLRKGNLIADIAGGTGLGITRRGIERLQLHYPNLKLPPAANHVVEMRMNPGDDDCGI